MSRFVLRARAEADLADIWRYTSRRWSVMQADKYHREMEAAFRGLAERPSLGRTCDEVRAGYRRHNVGSHVIFYLITEGVVDIVRILHARRDFQRHLPSA